MCFTASTYGTDVLKVFQTVTSSYASIQAGWAWDFISLNMMVLKEKHDRQHKPEAPDKQSV